MKKLPLPYGLEEINGWWYLTVDHGKRTEYSLIFHSGANGLLRPVQHRDQAVRVARKLLRQSRI